MIEWIKRNPVISTVGGLLAVAAIYKVLWWLALHTVTIGLSIAILVGGALILRDAFRKGK